MGSSFNVINPSAVFVSRLPWISIFQRSWTEPNAEIAPNRQLRSLTKPQKFVGMQKIGTVIQSNKKFPKTKKTAEMCTLIEFIISMIIL